MTQRLRSSVSNGAAPSGRRLSFESLEGRAMLSLTHLYTFNDGTANDSVGAAHGTLVNGASIVDQKLALQNSGISSGDDASVQHVQLPADILVGNDATIEVWYAAANSSNWSRVFDIGNQVGSSGDSYLFFTQQSGSGDSRAAMRTSAGSEVVVTTGTSDDGAQHMAAVVIGGGRLRLYMDGQEVGSSPLSGRTTANSINDTLNYLGRSLFDGDPGFTGLIDEVRIYDNALSSGEIAAHAAEGPAVDALPGDYDYNGVVDNEDHATWRLQFGMSGANLSADGNGDGVVDAADYTVWRDNLGAGQQDPADQQLHDESLSVGTLLNTTIELTGDAQLHITGTGNPISGSEIRLNSTDAWLFFPNLRPSEVNAELLSQIRVNGKAAFHGITVRVVQYELGAVVIPHGYDFQPLQAFTGPQFTGESASFGLYTYYNNPGALGVMQQDVSSFTLKRGYMATIGSDANARHSKVYVAQDFDLEVSLLPEEHDNEVQFIRVFPWRWVAKKGASDIGPETLDAAWFYNWNNSEDSSFDYEYVPIRQQRWWPGYPTDKPDVTHLLGFNEPDNPVEDAYQTLNNGSVDAAIAVWPELLATGLRVGSPAVTDGGKAWLYEFMDKAIAADLRVDYIAIHNYQANHSAASLQNWLRDIYDRYQLPIWITEFNNGANWTGGADPTYQQNAQWVADVTDMMDNTPWIERYSIYSRVEAVREMTYSDGSLTPAGQVYHDNASPVGFVQDVLAPGPTSGRGIAQYAFDGDALDDSGYGYNGHVAGFANYEGDRQQGVVLDLDGATNYVQLPEGVASGDEFTFAGWVNWDGGGNWQRIFDFGNDTSSYLFLTPSNGSSMRFAIKDGGGEQVVQTSPLPVGQWTHVAVTLGGGSARLYVNGTLAATNNSVTIRPSDFNPTRNYLGDSQFANDPLFNGRLNDVLVTDYALTGAQIAALMTNTPPAFAAASLTLGPATRNVAFSDSVAGLATDPDAGDSVTYAKANGPAWLTVSSTGVLSGTPTAANQGLQEFVIAATDSRGAVTYTVLTIPVQDATARGMAFSLPAEPSTDSGADTPAAIQTAAAPLPTGDPNLLLTLDPQADPAEDPWAALGEPAAADTDAGEWAPADLSAGELDTAFAGL
ncbi:Glycosyl hydrolase catalytic core [Posidoniimonas corsicana]|uniref:Glycosyl hydrolase catalytic core n=1 Tax=Posidoniimonas corsicana TaxID=1938618 RepID=A0A5C5V345_9BACT|nr:LamG-like jellyroll fold domain-containing protein [Posidoniimonas corsicana]TWT32363.1 Glycosyl hydrolase catalytic core [Posidoniimonas corsicana]